jgi:hypothetical protein
MKAGSLPWAQIREPVPGRCRERTRWRGDDLDDRQRPGIADHRMRYRRDIDELAIRCTECKSEVDEFTAIAKGWRYYSDGTSLLPYCPECVGQTSCLPLARPSSIERCPAP